jgi:hypothetical protein
MANTHNHGANENNNNNNANPPPTLDQVLIMQAQMLQTMQQTMANMQQAQGQQQALQLQQCDRLGEFHRMKPPTFSHSVEPMDASDWFNTIEKKAACHPMYQPREGFVCNASVHWTHCRLVGRLC